MVDAERIEELRIARRLSVVGLAKAAGISRRTLYNIQAGETVGLETLVKISAALEVPLSEISPNAAKAIEAVA